MRLQTIKKDHLLARILVGLAEHSAMHGKVSEIPGHLQIEEGWHQLDESMSNWTLVAPAGAGPALRAAINDIGAELGRQYRLDLSPPGLCACA